jgi:hypothetical protein
LIKVRAMLETTTEVTCPYCGEAITLFLDLSVEEQTYIEDCSVCCQPMSVSYSAAGGELASISVETAG